MKPSSLRREILPQHSDPLDNAIDNAKKYLLSTQRADGHFVFEFEADATIPAEYILLTHYLGENVDISLESKIGSYLRRIQNEEGGWPLFHKGAFDMIASVKAYFALKMIGDDINSEHMVRAHKRDPCARRRGDEQRFHPLHAGAVYGVLKWHAVPRMPVEIMLLPKWFPFHMYKISYWGRTVLTPMLVLQALKPHARNPRNIHIDELFITHPHHVGPHAKAPHQSQGWFTFFSIVDKLLHWVDPVMPSSLRNRAMNDAVAFVKERLNGENGLGAIYPAMTKQA